MATATSRRPQLTLGRLMLLVLACALLLLPFSRRIRELEGLRLGRLRAVREAKVARELGRTTRAEALRRLHFAQVKPNAPPARQTQGNLWAALVVSQPLVRQGETTELKTVFSLVNETGQAVDPRIDESRLLVDGEELAEPSRSLSRTPREGRFQRLSPGESLRFMGVLGHHFDRPGEYRIVWEGPSFRSPEVVLRVLPRSPRAF